MDDKEFPKSRTTRFLQWTARVFGALVASYWLYLLILSLIYGSFSWDVESIIMAGLVTGPIIGVVIAWFREFIGGIFLLFIAIAHSIFAFIDAGHNKGLAMLISGGPFFVIGLLFIVAWRSSMISKRSTNGR